MRFEHRRRLSLDPLGERPHLLADLAITRGALAATPGDLSHLIGRPTTPLADTIAAALMAQHGAVTA